jgi:hypothetical protein
LSFASIISWGKNSVAKANLPGEMSETLLLEAVVVFQYDIVYSGRLDDMRKIV